jgi:hypothetical protein
VRSGMAKLSCAWCEASLPSGGNIRASIWACRRSVAAWSRAANERRATKCSVNRAA